MNIYMVTAHNREDGRVIVRLFEEEEDAYECAVVDWTNEFELTIPEVKRYAAAINDRNYKLALEIFNQAQRECPSMVFVEERLCSAKKQVARRIMLPIANICIELDARGRGAVTSAVLHNERPRSIPLEPVRRDNYAQMRASQKLQCAWDASINLLYTTLLAHVQAGIDIESKPYLAGVQAAIDELRLAKESS